ncbi:hypothetical protein D3C72_1711620 [compost metagenome]
MPIFDDKLMGWRQFHRHAGKVTICLLQTHFNQAPRRIMQLQSLPSHPLEHGKMIHVPVQNTGQRQQVQLFKLQLHRSAAQVQPFGAGNQLREGHAELRNFKLRTQRRQIYAMPIPTGNHRQARHAAFCGLRLAYQRQALSPAPVEPFCNVHVYILPCRLHNGSSSHSYRRRRSNSTSADTVIPTRNGSWRP